MSVLPNQKITLYVETARLIVHITRSNGQDDVVLVAAPIERRTLVPIGIGSRVQLEYKDTSHTGQGRYIAKGIVIRRVRGQVPMLEVRLFEPWQKIQERMFVRIDVLLETTYAPVLDGQIQAVSQCSIPQPERGGLWMLAQKRGCRGHNLALPALEQGSIQAYGEIVRVEDGEEGFGCSVSFVNLLNGIEKPSSSASISASELPQGADSAARRWELRDLTSHTAHADRLWERYKAKQDKQARKALIELYAPLVKYVAGRLPCMPNNVELEDLRATVPLACWMR